MYATYNQLERERREHDRLEQEGILEAEEEDEAAQPAKDGDTFDSIEKDIWVGDTGASAHMTCSLEGMYELKDYQGAVTVGGGDKLKVTKIGKKMGTVLQKDG